MRKMKRKNPLLIIAAVFILLVFLHLINILQPAERAIFSLIKPINTGVYNWGMAISSSYEESREKDRMSQEINKLRQELANLAIDKAKFHELEQENNRLRGLLEFSSRYDFNTILANVVAKEGIFSSSKSRDLVIDKGSNYGLVEGLAVLSEEGVIVGKIMEVKDESAKVCLTTSPGCQLAASVQNESQTQGLTDGRLGLTIEMNYIPQLEKIEVSEMVISSGLSAEIPRGLVIGKVSEVISESNEVWQSAIIEPILNFNNLTVVSIVMP